MSSPASSVCVTTSPAGTALMTGNPMASGAQLKMQGQTAIQIRPQQVIMPQGTGMGGSNIAMAMVSRLSLPFQATSANQSPTSMGGLRAITPATGATGPLLSQQVS